MSAAPQLDDGADGAEVLAILRALVASGTIAAGAAGVGLGDDDLGITADPEEFSQAVDALRGRTAVSDEDFDALDESEQARAFKVAGIADAEVAQDILDLLDDAVAEGTDFGEFLDGIDELEGSMESAWGEAGAEWETVFRTNLSSAYNKGRFDLFTDEQVAEDRPYWRFDAISDDRTDEDCEACNGTVLPSDDPWWAEHLPPLHYKCRCTFIALTAEEAADEGFEGEGPSVDVMDGFGGSPDEGDDEDLSIDLERFDGGIADHLRELLGED